MTLHIPDFSSARVLIAGDVMLDRYWQGSTARISPEAPVPVVRVESNEERPGGAGNVALNVAALGPQVTLAGLVGNDEAATALQRLLTEARVECLLERLSGCATVTKLRVLSRHQQLLRLDFEGGFHEPDALALAQQVIRRLPECDALVLSDYGKGTLSAIPEIIAAARKTGQPVLVDPKGRNFEPYRGASLMTPNLSEFEAVVGHCADEDDLVRKGEALRRALALSALVITRSERGMTLLREGQPALHLSAQAREVFDVTGAGDTVIAAFAAALAAGADMATAARLANLAAGIVVGKLGAASVSVAELHGALQTHAPARQGVVSESELLEMVSQARARGESIVMTNGCFDILHAGHVRYLEQARRLGDHLIIAVNDDASVRALKGTAATERPVNPLSVRMELLVALKCVDWVVPFSEDTPERLICSVLPDKLVKGGDYKPEQVAGHRCVLAHGGEVRILNYEPGHSTTRIIEKLRAAKPGNITQ